MKNTVLLIDKDSRMNDKNEQLLLTHFNNSVEVIKIPNPIKALEFINQQKKNANSDKTIHLFLGLHFPNSCGFEFMEELEDLELDNHFDFKVYLLSADNSVYVHEKKSVFPMVEEYIQKPLTKDKLAGLTLAA